jgi:hypothetical protein
MLKSKILTKYSTEIATAPLFEILYVNLDGSTRELNTYYIYYTTNKMLIIGLFMC